MDIDSNLSILESVIFLHFILFGEDLVKALFYLM